MIFKTICLMALLHSHWIFALTPQDVINMPANTWLTVPNSQMMDVAPAWGEFAGTSGTGGAASVLDYSGAVFDTKRDRLILWGGGHAGYNGNELYAFNIPTMTWERLNDPTINPGNDHDALWDGTPSSRHTYNGMAYIAHADRLVETGGSPYGNGSAACAKTWTFDFAAKKWTDHGTPGTAPSAGYECNASYDQATKRVWFGNDNAAYWRPNGTGLYSYDFDNNRWAKHTSEDLSYRVSTIDTKRGLYVLYGQDGQVYAYNIRSGTPVRQIWTTTGGGLGRNKMGLDYDPVADRIVGWGGGNAVWSLNPGTKAWTSYAPSGGPSGYPQGTYGRWRYVSSVNAFVCVHDANDNVHFFKMTAGVGVQTPAPEPAAGKGLAVGVTPNPVVSTALISLRGDGLSEWITLSIYNGSGRLIERKEGSGAEMTWTTGAALPAGLYLVRAQSGRYRVVTKILLQR